MSKVEELDDARIDEFLDKITSTVEYIKWGGRYDSEEE